MAEEQTEIDEVEVDEIEEIEGERSQTDDRTEDLKVDEQKIETAAKTAEDFDKKLDEEDSQDDEDEFVKEEQQKEVEKPEAKITEKEEVKKATDDKEVKKDDTDDANAVDDELLTRAVRAGLSISEASSFSSSETLSKVINKLEGSSSQGSERKQEVNKDKGGDEFKITPYETKFEDETEFDPELTANLKGANEHYSKQLQQMDEHYKKQMKTVTDQVNSLQTSINNQASLDLEKSLDGMFNELPSEYKGVVGKGTGRSLEKGGTQITNRIKVKNAMSSIDKTYIDSGKELLPEKELFKQAVGIVFADIANEIATKKITKKVVTRGGQAIGRPASSNRKPLSQNDKAYQTSSDFDKKLDNDDDD